MLYCKVGGGPPHCCLPRLNPLLIQGECNRASVLQNSPAFRYISISGSQMAESRGDRAKWSSPTRAQGGVSRGRKPGLKGSVGSTARRSSPTQFRAAPRPPGRAAGSQGGPGFLEAEGPAPETGRGRGKAGPAPPAAARGQGDARPHPGPTRGSAAVSGAREGLRAWALWGPWAGLAPHSPWED